MDKHDIVHILEEIATLLELKGENPFKIQAYRTAARRLEILEEDFNQLVKEHHLQEIQGIGKALAEKITTLYESGELPLYEELKKTVPTGLQQLLEIPGLGAKKVKAIYDHLQIQTIKALKSACKKGLIAKLPGFGIKTEKNIIEGIRHLEEYSQRHLWWDAMEFAQPILEQLKRLKYVDDVAICGSVRRKLETIGDLDFLVASSQPNEVMNWFTTLSVVARVTAKGPTKSSVRFHGGMQGDLRVVPKNQFAYALHYFTGSKEHNVKIRHLARQKRLTLSEWGLEPINGKGKSPIRKKIPKEEDIFHALGLPYIPPEIREDRGEIDLKKIPILVEYKDIKGVFHNHTTASDGRNTLEEMATAAEEMGWEYLGISDHSKASVQANGLDEKRLLQQIEQINHLNKSKKYSVHLFSGTECDILSNGALDYSDDILKLLDYVVVSIHSGFKQDEKTITNRLIKAIENPYTTMVGHLTGRLLLRREPYALNIPKVIDAAIANDTIIEINAHPLRLDMDWRYWHAAAERGLLCSINPDAHNTEGLKYYKAGVNIARKGWLQKKHVINTFSLEKVKKKLRQYV